MNAKLSPAQKLTAALATVLWLAVAAQAQSLWQSGISKPMYADKRGINVGDIITVVISENTTANKNNETATERKSSLTSAISSFFYSPAASSLLTKGGTLPALAYDSDHTHDGKGSINDSETIVAQIAVRIIDVLPNGNLVIEGKRDTSFSNEHQTVILRGIVRADDVSSENTVFSYNVADATIQIIGKGTVTDSQNKGWFNRIWDKLNPF